MGEALAYCENHREHFMFRNKSTGAITRGVVCDHASWQDIPVRMNVLICEGLIKSLDKLMQSLAKKTIRSYYEIGMINTPSDPRTNEVSVTFHFYSRGSTTDMERNIEDQILKEVGVAVNSFSR